MFLATLLFAFNVAWGVEYAEVLSMDTLMEEAEQTVHGQVVNTESEWGEDGLIYTRVTLDVEDSLYTVGHKPVSFLVPGGQVGDVVLTIPGSPTFQVGKNVLVFLTEGRLLGLGQGVFSVQDDLVQRGLEKMAKPISLKQIFGDAKEARGCSTEGLMRAYEDGWSLRGHVGFRLRTSDAQAVEVTLIEGMEYSVQVCGDGASTGLDVQLVDLHDNALIHAEVGGLDDEIRFSVPRTGAYWLTAYNKRVSNGWHTAVDFSIRYR